MEHSKKSHPSCMSLGKMVSGVSSFFRFLLFLRVTGTFRGIPYTLLSTSGVQEEMCRFSFLLSPHGAHGATRGVQTTIAEGTKHRRVRPRLW